MVGIWRSIYYFMNWDYPKDIATKKTIHQRHLVLKQIRDSKLKLHKTNKFNFDEYKGFGWYCENKCIDPCD